MVEFLIINKQIPIFTEYFYAVSLSDETTDIFNTSVGSFELTPHAHYKPYDVVVKIIKPLENKLVNPVLKRLGDKLLVPLEGYLVLPDEAAFPDKRPMVLIGHGNHAGYVGIDSKRKKPTLSPEGVVIKQGEFKITVFDKPVLYTGPGPAGDKINFGEQIPSFVGYGYFDWFDTKRELQLGFQKTLAAKGIASYSINLNIVNALDNNEQKLFQKFALDFNQRILLFFHHLKLLKILAGETVTEPTGENALPLKFLQGSTFVNLRDALASPTPDPRLDALKNVLANKIDFTNLGFMGHSRGADAVSRIPAYFHKSTPFTDPVFPKHTKVNDRIKNLSVQIGSPLQQHIKCILALEPTAEINKEEPDNHGYVIDNNQTMYFVVVGTHDEDVSMDPVRIYEFPKCPKVMIAINGATHTRFNSVWAGRKKKSGEQEEEEEVFDKLEVEALSIEQHANLLNSVCGSCFTGSLGGNPSHLLPFTKKTDFVFDMPLRNDFQNAWKFGFPFAANTPVNLDDKVTSPSQESIQGQGYKFEQELKAFFVEKNNEGTVTIRIPIDPNKLSNFSHFSFRFAKGFDVSSNETRVEEKNFTIQFFENDTPVGKPIAGGDIETLKLRAFEAVDITENNEKIIEYSILMQTAEITLAEHLSSTELPRITRIDINIIPDDTKAPPNSTAKVYWTIVGGILGGVVGVGGAAILDPGDGETMIWSGIAGTAAGVGIALIILKADKHAFVFEDFLLTNREIP